MLPIFLREFFASIRCCELLPLLDKNFLGRIFAKEFFGKFVLGRRENAAQFFERFVCIHSMLHFLPFWGRIMWEEFLPQSWLGIIIWNDRGNAAQFFERSIRCCIFLPFWGRIVWESFLPKNWLGIIYWNDRGNAAHFFDRMFCVHSMLRTFAIIGEEFLPMNLLGKIIGKTGKCNPLFLDRKRSPRKLAINSQPCKSKTSNGTHFSEKKAAFPLDSTKLPESSHA